MKGQTWFRKGRNLHGNLLHLGFFFYLLLRHTQFLPFLLCVICAIKIQKSYISQCIKEVTVLHKIVRYSGRKLGSLIPYLQTEQMSSFICFSLTWIDPTGLQLLPLLGFPDWRFSFPITSFELSRVMIGGETLIWGHLGSWS